MTGGKELEIGHVFAQRSSGLCALLKDLGQTKLRHGEQVRILRMIPGLEQAEFARLGGLHRNTFINGPKLLGPRLHLKSDPRLVFAGQT